MEDKKLLPVGSVILLKEGKKKVMITGFYVTNKENKEMYDYTGCLYPEGVISSDFNLMFNHNQIETVYHMGLKDEEEENFKKSLNEEYQKMMNSNDSEENKNE